MIVFIIIINKQGTRHIVNGRTVKHQRQAKGIPSDAISNVYYYVKLYFNRLLKVSSTAQLYQAGQTTTTKRLFAAIDILLIIIWTIERELQDVANVKPALLPTVESVCTALICLTLVVLDVRKSHCKCKQVVNTALPQVIIMLPMNAR